MTEKCNCGYYPTVIIPGIGHSRVELVDDVGNSKGYCFPPEIETSAFVKGVLPCVLKMCITRNTEKYTPELKEACGNILGMLELNCEGKPKALQRVESYNYPLSQFSDSFKRYIYACVPLMDLADVIGEDHLYFYAFNSFGQPYESAEGLHRFIQTVKAQTGHDKVNLIAISLGGCVSVAYLDSYAHKGDVHRIINFVPAINGTQFLADIIDNKLDLDRPMELFELFTNHSTAEKICGYLDKIPKKVYYAVLGTVIEILRERLILNCANMWGTIPKEKYPELRDKYLKGAKYSILRAKADRLHRAHLNYEANVKKAMKTGTQFFDICGYGRKLIALSPSDTVSSDGVIDTYGASAFAHVAPLGETFPEDYKQHNKACTRKKHNHISPDRTVDASAGLFPETTWYFKDQFHDAIAYNDVALKLCREILTNDDFVDVHSDPRFPQFNGCRNVRAIRYNLLPRAEKADRTKLTHYQVAELDAAVKQAQNMLENTIIESPEEAEKAQRRLSAALTEV